jgi:hypothetical protein
MRSNALEGAPSTAPKSTTGVGTPPYDRNAPHERWHSRNRLDRKRTHSLHDMLERHSADASLDSNDETSPGADSMIFHGDPGFGEGECPKRAEPQAKRVDGILYRGSCLSRVTSDRSLKPCPAACIVLRQQVAFLYAGARAQPISFAAMHRPNTRRVDAMYATARFAARAL